MSTRITISYDCAGTGQCVLVAPEIFALDSDGLSTVIGQPETPEALDAARRAEELCPMAAIHIED